MIPLNSRQFLPAKAFWYLAFRALFAAVLLVLFARFWHFLATSPSAKCTGALCGKSGGAAEWMFYLLAGFMLVNSILQFKWFSFTLTRNAITIDSGVIVQKSRAVRFDKIQDVEVRRSVLQGLLGLKSVAIWTASLDQARGNTRRPDGLIVLDADSADWLANFLISPDRTNNDPAKEADRDVVPATGRSRPGHFGALIGIVSVAVVLVLTWGFWTRSGSAPQATSSVAAPVATATPAPVAAVIKPVANAPPTAETYSANSAAMPEDYTIACAANSTNAAHNIVACNSMKWGQRCDHEADFRSNPTSESTRLVIANRSDRNLKFYWLDAFGHRTQYAVLTPGRKIGQQSHVGAHWLVSTDDERCVGIFNADTARIGIF